MKINGVPTFVADLRKRIALSKSLDNGDVEVGYATGYALYVHEATGKLKGQRRSTKGRYWDPQARAQPKFLETPLRTERNQMHTTIKNGLRSGLRLMDAVTLAGLHLQRQSQLLVPVDTGNLKGSAFTRRVR